MSLLQGLGRHGSAPAFDFDGSEWKLLIVGRWHWGVLQLSLVASAIDADVVELVVFFDGEARAFPAMNASVHLVLLELS